MDRDPNENHLDPVERETSSTGENDTGEVGSEAARIMKGRRDKGTEPKQVDQPAQTKSVPDPSPNIWFKREQARRGQVP